MSFDPSHVELKFAALHEGALSPDQVVRAWRRARMTRHIWISHRLPFKRTKSTD